jgi:hypothetical protein
MMQHRAAKVARVHVPDLVDSKYYTTVLLVKDRVTVLFFNLFFNLSGWKTHPN